MNSRAFALLTPGPGHELADQPGHGGGRTDCAAGDRAVLMRYAADTWTSRSNTPARRYLALDQSMILGPIGNELLHDRLRSYFSRGGPSATSDRLWRPRSSNTR